MQMKLAVEWDQMEMYYGSRMLNSDPDEFCISGSEPFALRGHTKGDPGFKVKHGFKLPDLGQVILNFCLTPKVLMNDALFAFCVVYLYSSFTISMSF